MFFYLQVNRQGTCFDHGYTQKEQLLPTEHNNLVEYEDPILYDCETHHFEPVGPFYLALAQRFGGSVLELGCGTGRYTIPLAQAGVEMTGLDIMPPMLERARQKAKGLPITLSLIHI